MQVLLPKLIRVMDTCFEFILVFECCNKATPSHFYPQLKLRLYTFVPGLLPLSSSYLSDFPNVFVSATGTGFYEQCFPSDSVNLGFSCLAIQWLRKKPCNLTRAILHSFSEVPQERNMFAKQAEKDWEQFLLMRAKELAKGEKHVYTDSKKNIHVYRVKISHREVKFSFTSRISLRTCHLINLRSLLIMFYLWFKVVGWH